MACKLYDQGTLKIHHTERDLRRQGFFFCQNHGITAALPTVSYNYNRRLNWWTVFSGLNAGPRLNVRFK